MRKISSRQRPKRDDLRPEYRFDYRKAKPNRYAETMSKDAVAVVLDPDVAEVFGSSQSVNTVLRTLISVTAKRHTR